MRWLPASILALACGTLAAAEDAPDDEPPRVVSCWRGLAHLQDLGGTAGLAAIRDVLPAALASGDESLLTFLRERLAEVIADDAKLALAVLDLAAGADGPELLFYMEALAETKAVHAREVADALVTMGEAHEGVLHRAAALSALETQRRHDDPTLARLATLTADTEPEVALQAIKALGAPLEHDTERADAYMARLLDAAGATADESRRILALEMGTYGDAPFGDASLAGLASYLSDPARSVRETAALVMSTGSDSDAVLAHFRAAFLAETDECVRWALFRFSVRAAGERALPALEDMVASDARFAGDLRVIRALYAAGVVDFERIWDALPDRHACNVDEDEGPHPL